MIAVADSLYLAHVSIDHTLQHILLILDRFHLQVQVFHVVFVFWSQLFT